MGALLTKVTIGYDTPWCQVHAMLELAARRCQLLNQSEPSVGHQLNLQEWYAEYELQIRMNQGVAQPEQMVLVSRENWDQAPAEALSVVDPASQAAPGAEKKEKARLITECAHGGYKKSEAVQIASDFLMTGPLFVIGRWSGQTPRRGYCL